MDNFIVLRIVKMASWLTITAISFLVLYVMLTVRCKSSHTKDARNERPIT
jgi:hypothetical protein